MKTELICFEVETLYKSGRKRTEVIAAESEEKCGNITISIIVKC